MLKREIVLVRADSKEDVRDTSGPASAQDISAVNRTTERMGSSSDVGTTVVIVAIGGGTGS